MTTQLPMDVLPEVAAFLDGGPLGAVIGGQNAASSNQAVFATHDPGS